MRKSKHFVTLHLSVLFLNYQEVEDFLFLHTISCGKVSLFFSLLTKIIKFWKPFLEANQDYLNLNTKITRHFVKIVCYFSKTDCWTCITFKMSAFWIFSLRRGGAAAAGWQTIGNIDRNISFSIAEGTKELFLYTDKRNSIANI